MEEQALLELVKENPDEGIHIAMHQYGKAINTICKSLLEGCMDGLAEEAVVDTFFKLWKNIDKISLGGGYSLKSYLYSIARNTAIDLRRKHGYSLLTLEEQEAIELADERNIEMETERKELRKNLYQAIIQLGQPDSTIFLQKYYLKRKNKDIAAGLQLPEKKIENILYYGKKKLRKLLVERGITCYENG